MESKNIKSELRHTVREYLEYYWKESNNQNTELE